MWMPQSRQKPSTDASTRDVTHNARTRKNMRIYIYLILISLSHQSCGQTKLEKRTINEFAISIGCSEKVSIEKSASKDISELKCEMGNTSNTIRVTTYKNNMYHSDSLNNLDFDLDYSQRYFTNTGKVDLIGMILKTVKGYPGKEYRFQYKFEDKIDFRRVFIIKNNVVELIYEAPKSKLYHTEIDGFFNSFSIENFDENPVPYINMPTEEEIANRPFEAKFPADTKQIVEANYSDFGKLALVIEMCELKPELNDGVMALSVLYTDFPNEMSQENKNEMFEIHKMTQEVTFPNFKWIDNEEPQGSQLKLKFEYSIGDTRVIDSRKLIFEGNRMYTIVGISTKQTEPNNRVNEFLKNFKIKSTMGNK